MFSKLTLFFFLSITLLTAKSIDTFYGPIEVEESVLLELIESPAMQRLKEIHQYGVAYYTQTHTEEFNRYDHSIGVFALLKKNGASLEEQISGLLHDISHTVFSHVGDWVFGKEHQKNDYQGTIFKLYLALSGAEDILIKYGYTINQVSPKDHQFIRLEQPLPNLCADRIDYNIQGAYFQDFLTKEEALALYEDFQFLDGRWVATRADLLMKLARFSVFMTEDCWGSAENYATSRWLADAMIRGLQTGLLSWKEIHFGIDQTVWDKLLNSSDLEIQDKMDKLKHREKYFWKVTPENADMIVKFRFRGIDPWVMHNGEQVRLTSIQPELAGEFEALKETSIHGWPIKIFR